MKDLLLSSTDHCDRDGLKVTNNKISHSIVNSVTNDEDDWLDSRKNSGHSIVNSVTNDEDDDEWIGHRNDSRGVAISIQPRPRNYQSVFFKQEIAIKGLKQTESTLPPNPSLSMFERERFANNRFDKESFLIRYEDMMNEQEKEQTSTISHLQFFLELLMDLQLVGQDGVNGHQRFDENKDNCLLIEFSIEDLKHAQKKLQNSEKYDIIKTDKQFLMVLDILCEDNDDSPEKFSSEIMQKQISWAEIVQCYRYCVVGMQTLEMIGSESSIRKRTKERTLALLSAYRESSSINSSPSIKTLSGTSDVVGSDKTYDRSVVNSSRVDEGTQQDTKSRRLLNHPLVSFFTRAMVIAILFYYQSSSTQSTYYQDAPSARRTQDAKYPIEVNASSYSTGGEFEVFEKTVDKSQDLVHMLSTKGDPGPSKRKSLVTTTGHAVSSIARARTSSNDSLSPSTSSKNTIFDPKLGVANEYDNKIIAKGPSSFDIKVANVLGGTATIIYFLSTPTGSITAVLGWLPTGLGVVMAAFAARTSIRDGVSNIWKNLKFNRKKENAVSA